MNVSVQLVNATEPKDVRFHLYDREGRRVRYERVVETAELPVRGEWPSREKSPPSPRGEKASDLDTPHTGNPPGRPGPAAVAWDDVQCGWENDAGEVLLLTREEIEQVRP